MSNKLKTLNEEDTPPPLPKTSINKVQKAIRLIDEWRKLAMELKPQLQLDTAFTLEECAQDLDRILRSK